MKKFEYKLVKFSGKINFEEELNKLGKEGWELIFTNAVLLGDPGIYICLFKRLIK